MKQKAVIFWSGGKDSAFALYMVMQQKEYEVAALITTINTAFDRVSMHGVRSELIEAQAKAIGLPLVKMFVSEGTNSEYEQKFIGQLGALRADGITHVIFGDIFLEDLRLYRDALLKKAGMTGVYPLWKSDTSILINEFLRLGFKTITCCTNALLGKERVGAMLDEKFISSLPSPVDPCGENGEYHTFCFYGPIFRHPVQFSIGEIVYRPLEGKTAGGTVSAVSRSGFWFCELA